MVKITSRKIIIFALLTVLVCDCVSVPNAIKSDVAVNASNNSSSNGICGNVTIGNGSGNPDSPIAMMRLAMPGFVKAEIAADTCNNSTIVTPAMQSAGVVPADH